MRCGIQGCPGEYEDRLIVHTVKRGGDVLVFEKVPAEVCNICSDTLLAPETVRHLEGLIRHNGKPGRYAPVYEYAQLVRDPERETIRRFQAPLEIIMITPEEFDSGTSPMAQAARTGTTILPAVPEPFSRLRRASQD